MNTKIKIMTVSISILSALSATQIAAAAYGSSLCKNSAYFCRTIQRGESWQSLFPNAAQRDLVMRINRMNTRLYPGLRIAIPDSRNLNPMSYSPLPTQINPPGEKIIYVSLSRLAFGAYNTNGSLEYWGPVSGGRGYCSDIGRGCHTSTGNFSIHSKEGAGCFSTKFPVGRGGAPMPYCMFFKGGYALHGSYEVPGYNASHGCVRMFIDDAKWLNQEFTAGEWNTPVIIRE